MGRCLSEHQCIYFMLINEIFLSEKGIDMFFCLLKQVHGFTLVNRLMKSTFSINFDQRFFFSGHMQSGGFGLRLHGSGTNPREKYRSGYYLRKILIRI